MFKNKTKDGSSNVCGKNIARLRKALQLSQNDIAHQLQLVGIDVDKNAIQRIECGKRNVIDIEKIALAKVFNVTFEELLKE